MSFGVSAATWTAIAAGTAAATTLYGAVEQRRTAADQQRALSQAQAKDAAQAARVETDAAVAANATLAAKKRGRQTSALATGAIGSAGVTPLGGSTSPLSSVKPTTALGAGSLV